LKMMGGDFNGVWTTAKANRPTKKKQPQNQKKKKNTQVELLRNHKLTERKLGKTRRLKSEGNARKIASSGKGGHGLLEGTREWIASRCRSERLA